METAVRLRLLLRLLQLRRRHANPCKRQGLRSGHPLETRCGGKAPRKDEIIAGLLPILVGFVALLIVALIISGALHLPAALLEWVK